MAQIVGTDRASDVGRQQSLFREVNEQIERLAESFDLLDQVPIICECGSSDCKEQIQLTQAEYEDLRRIPTHFAVLSGHDMPEVERIIEANDRYVVVEKTGEGAIAAIKLDPRRRQR